MAISDYTPAVADLALLIPSRAAGRWTGGAEEAPTFPDTNRVEAAIGMATGLVAARLGGEKLAPQFYAGAKALITMKSAMLLEPAAWPEQARPDKSAWEQWQAQYDADMPALVEDVARHRDDWEDDEGPGSSQGPIGSFPAPGLQRPCPEEW